MYTYEVMGVSRDFSGEMPISPGVGAADMALNFTFDNYRFETESGRLGSGALELRLTPKASAVLKGSALQKRLASLKRGQPFT